jgi:hypothetical protein
VVVEDGALNAFVVAAVMNFFNFFNYWHTYQLVLSMHGEP